MNFLDLCEQVLIYLKDLEQNGFVVRFLVKNMFEFSFSVKYDSIEYVYTLREESSNSNSEIYDGFVSLYWNIMESVK